MIPIRHLPWGVALLSFSVGCSLINKPDAIKPGGGGGAGGTISDGGGPPTGCKTDDECTALTVGCAIGSCDLASGKCVGKNAPKGTPCGAAPMGDCDAPDTCDDAGTCTSVSAPDGTFCSDCPSGPGKCSLCNTGQCGDCGGRATLKTFRTPLSTAGWTFTGGWGLYEQTPASTQPAFLFARPVVGTDGNRAHPYPGEEKETSYALSPPSIIPPAINFKSWSYDEGGGINGQNVAFDQKTISVSIDGGQSFTVVAFCSATTQYDFCHPVDGVWRDISLNLAAPQFGVGHPELIGQTGIIKFSYDTGDGCCTNEQGWYIDALNVATDCACHSDDECSLFSGTCGTGACDLISNECGLTPKNGGGSCGDTMSETCSGPDTCDPDGFCNINYQPKEGVACQSCTEGMGECLACGGGDCLNCPETQTFDENTLDTTGWTFTGGWFLYTSPPSQSPPPAMQNVPFGAHGRVLGVDGAPVAPYWTFNGNGYTHQVAVETSSFTSPPTIIPATLKFDSWNVDRGGQSGRDEKRISISTDGGSTFKVLVDCQGAMNTLPFCSQVMTRAPDAWDAISIDTGALAGKTGILKFDYDSLDSGSGFEQGWYIDNINLMRCGAY